MIQSAGRRETRHRMVEYIGDAQFIGVVVIVNGTDMNSLEMLSISMQPIQETRIRSNGFVGLDAAGV